MDVDLVIEHAQRSFSSEDQNFEARFWLAQLLFLKGDKAGAQELFATIDDNAPPYFRPKAPVEDNEITARLPRDSGTVASLKEQFFFIRSGSYGRDLFSHMSDLDPRFEADLSEGQFVDFQVRFNRQGPVAIDVRPTRA